MSQLPSVEILERSHQFPCAYVFKAIGGAEGNFIAEVVATVKKELGMDADPPYSLRQSGGGRHVAITLEPLVQTAEQVLAVYRGIQQIHGLVLLL